MPEHRIATLTDTDAVDQIHALLDNHQWSVSDLDSIASIVEHTGRQVREFSFEEEE